MSFNPTHVVFVDNPRLGYAYDFQQHKALDLLSYVRGNLTPLIDMIETIRNPEDLKMYIKVHYPKHQLLSAEEYKDTYWMYEL